MTSGPTHALPTRAFAVALALLLLTVACADAGASNDGSTSGAAEPPPTRVIDVAMTDVAFEPASITVDAGETVTVRFTNSGHLVHDAFLGTEAEQLDHETEMTEMADMGHDVASSDSITVQPGQTGELTLTASDVEPMLIGCHQPGHYQAGMRLTVDVRS